MGIADFDLNSQRETPLVGTELYPAVIRIECITLADKLFLSSTAAICYLPFAECYCGCICWLG